MWGRFNVLICLVSVFALAGNGAAAGAIMQCDVGGCGSVESGWTGLDACGTYTNVAGSGIDVTLATGNPGACECRSPGGSGTLADVEADLLFANDEKVSPGSDFIITFSNLNPGASYRLLSYHSRTDEGVTTIPNVTVTGASNVTVPASIVQDSPIMDDPAEVLFTAGAGDVSVRYQGPDGGCNGCQAFLNGFVLEYAGPTISFTADASGAIETIGTAYVPVTLTNPESGQTYTVDYDVIGGTAQGGGVDYTVTPGTLTFNPGETSKNIEISIVNDANQEPDETVILELSNATGSGVMLGITQHTFTISDSVPKVSFNSASGSGFEHVLSVHIPVNLSHAGDQTVTVDYAVTGGSAAGGSDYVLLGDGTLSFDSGVTSQSIDIQINDDSITEPGETIQLTLSNPVNAMLGTITQYTYTIIDNEEGLVWDNKLWFYSGDTSDFFVNTDRDLEWSPQGGEEFITRIPEMSLSTVGDVVEVSYIWMTDGDHDCPDCFACPDGCYDDAITCIAGTSDMRVGLFQADGEYVQADGFEVTGSSIFTGYKGYIWRFGPNMLAGPTRWVDCTGEVHKTGQFCKKPVGNGDLMYYNDGLMEALPGLELPPGEYALFTVRLERTGSGEVEMTISLGDKSYSYTDDSSSDQPDKIDVLAVHMRNHRPYPRLVLLKVCRLTADIDGNDTVDLNDFKTVASWWLERCRRSDNYCQGGDLSGDRRVNLRDFAVLAQEWLEDCQ